jgi:demethylmenaquinone methyltransferase / 2-methoxy-6-polyprenyl-1,4-benzoquinol methylase
MREAAGEPARADAKGLPTGQEKVRQVRAMFDAIAPRYDLLNRVLTFGLDVGWRRAAVAELRLSPSSTVLDVACGTGDLCRELRAAGLYAVGFDMSSGMLAEARTKAPLVQADALRLPVATGVADGITCGFALRNVANLDALFEEFARTLRVAGRMSVLEVAEPRSRLARAAHGLYFRRIVPVVGGLLSDRDAYSYLPRSTAYLPPPEELIAMLEAAGFVNVCRRSVGMGAAQLISGTRS